VTQEQARHQSVSPNARHKAGNNSIATMPPFFHHQSEDVAASRASTIRGQIPSYALATEYDTTP